MSFLDGRSEERAKMTTKRETRVKSRQCLSGDVMPARRRQSENPQVGRCAPQNQPAGIADLDFVHPLGDNNPFHQGAKCRTLRPKRAEVLEEVPVCRSVGRSVGQSVMKTFQMHQTADSTVFLHSSHLSCLFTLIFIVVHSFIPSFIHSFIHSFFHSFISFFIHLFQAFILIFLLSEAHKLPPT